jgi:hypothetical protein
MKQTMEAFFPRKETKWKEAPPKHNQNTINHLPKGHKRLPIVFYSLQQVGYEFFTYQIEFLGLQCRYHGLPSSHGLRRFLFFGQKPHLLPKALGSKVETHVSL